MATESRTVVITGAAGAGKTSLLVRQLHAKFVTSYQPTFRLEYRQWRRRSPAGGEVLFHIWEVGGNPAYRAYPSHAELVAKADFLVFVYSVTSITNLLDLDSEISQCCGLNQTATRILVATKQDMPRFPGIDQFVSALCLKYSFYAHVGCSAAWTNGAGTVFGLFAKLSSQTAPPTRPYSPWRFQYGCIGFAT